MNPKDDIDIAGGDLLTIIGRGFPTELTEIEVVLDNVGETQCITQTLTSTQVTCILNEVGVEGTFDVIVKAYGEERIPGAIEVITPFEATSVTPTDNIDIAGGDILTITGRGFPDDPADIEVELSDGTDCVTLTLTSTQITCRLDPASAEGTFNVLVTADGVTEVPG